MIKFDLNSLEDTKAVVAVLFQQDGTARGCDGNMTINLFNKPFKLAIVRKALKDAHYNRGERKFARTIATDIHKICETLEIPGNLYQKIVRDNPDLKLGMRDQAWLSDFQSTNTDAPLEMRSLIIKFFNKKPLPIINKQRRTGK